MNWFWIGGISFAIMSAPFILFELGKCSVRHRLRENIKELEKIKRDSSEEITELINIHLEELAKHTFGLDKFGILKGLK